jgi:hypothetical protein
LISANKNFALYVTTELNLFSNLNLDNYCTRKLCGRASVFAFTSGIFSGFGSKKWKKTCFESKEGCTITFFNADHHFEPHRIGL